MARKFGGEKVRAKKNASKSEMTTPILQFSFSIQKSFKYSVLRRQKLVYYQGYWNATFEQPWRPGLRSRKGIFHYFLKLSNAPTYYKDNARSETCFYDIDSKECNIGPIMIWDSGFV